MEDKQINKPLAEETEKDVNSEETKKKPSLPPHKEYAKRMLSYREKYIKIVAASGAVVAASIPIALYLDLLIGIALAIFGAVFYMKFASNEMYNTLGLDYKTYTEGISITTCRARYGDVVWIPQGLAFFEVTRIEDRAFCTKHNAELRCVFLPRSLRSIGKDVFEGCNALEDIFFEGTEEEWKNVVNETDFSAFRLTFDAKYPPITKNKKKKKPKNISAEAQK